MADDEFRDWRRDEDMPRDPGEAEPFGTPSGGSGDLSNLPPSASYPGSPAPISPGPAGVRAQSISCPNCQYNLTGATIGMSCPECGMVVGSGLLGVGSGMPTSGKAVASLVLGIVSIVGCMFYGLPSLICGPLALIFARQAKGQLNRGEVNPSSASMATAGFVCGLIGTILAVIGVGFIVLMIGAAILSSP